MDLYEALKAGTSADELLKKFQEELSDASARFEEEQRAQKKAEHDEELAEIRWDAANIFSEYFNALFEDDEDIFTTPEEVKEVLMTLEDALQNSAKNISALLSFLQGKQDLPKEKKTDSNSTIKVKYFKTDDEIIRDFINSLK